MPLDSIGLGHVGGEKSVTHGQWDARQRVTLLPKGSLHIGRYQIILLGDRGTLLLLLETNMIMVA